MNIDGGTLLQALIIGGCVLGLLALASLATSVMSIFVIRRNPSSDYITRNEFLSHEKLIRETREQVAKMEGGMTTGLSMINSSMTTLGTKVDRMVERCTANRDTCGLKQ